MNNRQIITDHNYRIMVIRWISYQPFEQPGPDRWRELLLWEGMVQIYFSGPFCKVWWTFFTFKILNVS